MRSFELDDKEIDVIRYGLSLLKRDCKFDLVTFSRLPDLDKCSELIETLSTIEFLQNKIKF